jgi:hypothetical protein
MMLGEDYEITEEMGDIEALQGVSQFPARIKCATLAWKALEKGTVEKEGKADISHFFSDFIVFTKHHLSKFLTHLHCFT